ncbi:MAG: hypothetical protein HUJ26_18210 [Planctomycetaceae bacterium]|nr:hypothetical protein [Planctomycetaceae bacterium]
METLFPFGFPTPTAFYLTLYVLTFVLHQALMHYVLAGSGYLAWCNLVPGDGETPRTAQPLAKILRDWMPFALSAAITAGVAPLLFVQIVYPTEFYTANLLLWWRWMIVIPVLIVVFYLLYLVKTRRYSEWSFLARTSIAVFVSACFLFVGFCWTANHLISMHPDKWPGIYETGRTELSNMEVLLRMLIWTGGAFPTMCLMAAWQLPPSSTDSQIRLEEWRLARAALGGLFLATLAGIVYLVRLDDLSRGLILGSLGGPYLGITILGLLVQGGLWFLILQRGGRPVYRVILSGGCTLALVGASVLRETIRLAHLDLEKLASHHEQAADIGGWLVFLVMAVVNVAVIGVCVVMVRRGLASQE